MTLEQFNDDIVDFGDLKTWCWDNDCDICDSIYSEDDRDSIIDEDLYNWAREYNWREIYRMLSEIPTGDYYYLNGDYGWEEVEYDFERWKDDVRDWGIENGAFDDEEESAYDCLEDETDPYELEPIEDEDILLSDMFSDDVVDKKMDKNEEKTAEQQEENESEDSLEETFEDFKEAFDGLLGWEEENELMEENE